jgi:hypothetical protein
MPGLYCQRWARKLFFVSPQILGLIPQSQNLQISEVYQSANLQIFNDSSANFPGVPVCNSQIHNFAMKK